MNPYKILGIDESATLDQIKSAYRERAARYHPDAGGDAWAFQQVQEAYDLLLKKHQVPPADQASVAAHTSDADASVASPQFGISLPKSRELLTVVGVILLVLVLVYWQYTWRIVVTLGGLAGCGGAVWLAYLATANRDERVKFGVAAGTATVVSLSFLYLAWFSGGYPYVPVKELSKTSVTMVLTFSERELREPQVSTGSAFVVEDGGGKLTLLTNSHCLNLATVAELSAKQRDRTANVTSYKMELVFPSGKRRAVSRIAESPAPDMIDAAKLEVSSQGLTKGVDYVLVPVVSNVIESIGVAIEDEVRAVGSPRGLENTSSRGWITNVRKLDAGNERLTVLQHSAPIDFGSSGGPLFVVKRGRGYCVGINSAIAGGQTIGFAHSLDDVMGLEYVWADCQPNGAVELLAKVHGIAAAVGDQPQRTFAKIPSKSQGHFSISKPAPWYAWPWILYLKWSIAIVTVLGGLWKLVEKALTSSDGEPAGNTPNSQISEKECPQCKVATFTMYADNRCPKCGYMGAGAQPPSSSLRVNCPSCKRANSIVASNLGTKIRCLHCQADFVANHAE